jgi:hypothetical protein
LGDADVEGHDISLGAAPAHDGESDDVEGHRFKI